MFCSGTNSTSNLRLTSQLGHDIYLSKCMRPVIILRMATQSPSQSLCSPDQRSENERNNHFEILSKTEFCQYSFTAQSYGARTGAHRLLPELLFQPLVKGNQDPRCTRANETTGIPSIIWVMKYKS